MSGWVQAVDGGCELHVLVQPRASRSRVVGEHGGLIKIQLAAPPVDGEANTALVALLAWLLRVPKRQISVVSGEASRRKRVRIAGVEPADAVAVMKGAE